MKEEVSDIIRIALQLAATSNKDVTKLKEDAVGQPIKYLLDKERKNERN